MKRVHVTNEVNGELVSEVIEMTEEEYAIYNPPYLDTTPRPLSQVLMQNWGSLPVEVQLKFSAHLGLIRTYLDYSPINYQAILKILDSIQPSNDLENTLKWQFWNLVRGYLV